MKPIQSAAAFCVAIISQSGSFPLFHSFSFIHRRFLMVCLPSMGLLRTANKVQCFIYVLNYVLLIKIVQTNLNDFCSKDTSNACCTPGNVACEIKKIHQLYLFTLFLCSYFSTVNTDSETAVVNVTYGTREQARQWVNFALISPNAIAKILILSSIVWPNRFSPQTHTTAQCWVGLDSQWFVNVSLSRTTKKSANDYKCMLCCNKMKYFNF